MLRDNLDKIGQVWLHSHTCAVFWLHNEVSQLVQLHVGTICKASAPMQAMKEKQQQLTTISQMLQMKMQAAAASQ